MKLFFIDELCGDHSGVVGLFRIFGTFHVIQYFRHTKAFLRAEQIVLTQVYIEIDTKYKWSFTSFNRKIFGGEKIDHINHHVWDEFVTESGLITRGDQKEATKFIVELRNPRKFCNIHLMCAN
ncbi:MAG: hypothetical protein EZS28_024400 [Streblomastix strix]|uniref:Uncharacterized protein n=1 Tax=Streblomastix strix TaxID=222440 RepID=A0A5J4VCA3_9EUKA|nr:MAG: hypothetical protein EZS28_024400 [Streblomastix strix]